MSLVKVEGVSNEVFFPDQITDEDKTFLVERTENIVGIVTRAKVEIGLELLKVEQRFREKKEFAGTNGWYQKWYMSLGVSSTQKQAFVNAATLALRLGDTNSEAVDHIANAVLEQLSPPSTNQGGKNRLTGGISSLATDVLIRNGRIGAEASEAVQVHDLGCIKDTSLSQLLAGEELLTKLQLDHNELIDKCQSEGYKNSSEEEQKRLRTEKSRSKKRLEEFKEKLKALESEKAALEAKYEDWRSPEAIKQEFEEAIAKARAEEKAKKESVKEVVKTVVDKSEADKIKAEYEALLKQNNELQAQIEKVEASRANWERMCNAADKKVQRMRGAAREWENWGWERRMDLINVYITHFAESAGMFNFCHGDVDDAARRALVSPEARFKAHEQRAIQAISMWINVLSVEGVQELKDVLEDRGELPPVEFVDSRDMVTIDV